MVPDPKDQPTEFIPKEPGRGSAGRPVPQTPADVDPPPQRIGPYRIFDTLGEGGMGVVYLAEQEKPIYRRVALKVIKLGMDTKQVIARFESERQALALMNHPGIAKVFDAGTTDTGRPYFVMEYVPGISITEYCDRHRLPTQERLRLFMDVCHAVQHAHQKGIIHRDLKPSNVLVAVLDGQPVPKVIDFGVAKATQHRLTERTLFTEQGQLIGTPGYMSPEQAEMTGLDVDTRTDIYSLGVMMYELLVGALPFDTDSLRRAGLSEIQRMIREVDPPRPSTKLTSLGDASTMVAQRRRTEPRTLAREVRGDLDWVVMKCLEKDRTRRYDSAAAIAEEMVRHLGHRPVLAGPPQITYRLKKFTRRHSKPLLATSICAILAAIAVSFYAKTRATARELRDQQATGLFYQAMLDSHSRPDDALKMLHRVTELSPEFLKARIQRAYLFKRENRLDEARSEAEAILADHPETGPAHLLLAQLYSDRDVQKSDFHRAKGMRLSPNDRYYAAMAMGPEDNEAAVVLLSSLLDEDGGHFDARWARGWRYRDMGNYEAMLEDAEFLTDLRSKSATAWNMRGVALSRLLKLDQAEAAYGRAIELAPDYAGTYVNRADLFVRMKRLGDALRDCNRALELEPDFGLALAQRAWVYIRMGDLAVTKADQMGHLERAETDCTYVLERDRGNAFAWHRLGNVHARRGQSEEAYDAFSKALEIRPRLTQALTDRGVVAYELERYEDSLQDHSKAVELDPSDDVALSRKAGTLYRLDRLEEAEANLSKAISLNRENGEGWNDRARIRRSLGRLDEAMLDHNQAVELWPAAQAYAGRGITRRALGDHAGAVQDIQRAIDSTPRQNALSRLWLWEIFSLSGTPGDREKAERQLAEARSVAANDWERLVISAVTGETPSETLLAAADDVGKRLEAFHALGSRALVEGKTDEARRWFQQCVDLKAVHFMEHDLALMHLRSLEAAER